MQENGRFNMQLCNHEAVALILDGADQEGGWGGVAGRGSGAQLLHFPFKQRNVVQLW